MIRMCNKITSKAMTLVLGLWQNLAVETIGNFGFRSLSISGEEHVNIEVGT